MKKPTNKFCINWLNTMIPLMIIIGLPFLFVSCGNNNKSSSDDETDFKESSVKSFRKKKGKQTTVHFRATGFETGLMDAKCDDFKCSHYSGTYFRTDGNTISTDDIIIPEGEVWSYKDYEINYDIAEKNENWVTRPFINYSVDGVRWKTCKIPNDVRTVRFYPGDRIRIGTYASATRGRYNYIDVQVAFYVEHLR